MKKPATVASKPIHQGRVITISTETLRYTNGREHELDFVRHPGAAAVVAVDAENRVCVVRQYRHGIGDFLWEIPAGKLDPGEAPAACAVRELAEETGVRADYWTALGVFLPLLESSPKSYTCTLPAACTLAWRRRMWMRNWSCNGCRSITPSTRFVGVNGMTGKLH